MDGHRRPAGDQVGLPPLLAPEPHPGAWPLRRCALRGCNLSKGKEGGVAGGVGN